MTSSEHCAAQNSECDLCANNRGSLCMSTQSTVKTAYDADEVSLPVFLSLVIHSTLIYSTVLLSLEGVLDPPNQRDVR